MITKNIFIQGLDPSRVILKYSTFINKLPADVSSSGSMGVPESPELIELSESRLNRDCVLKQKQIKKKHAKNNKEKVFWVQAKNLPVG